MTPSATTKLLFIVALIAVSLLPSTLPEKCPDPSEFRDPKEDEIVVTIHPNATLFTAPGRTHSVDFSIQNTVKETTTVMVSFREDYPPSKHHFEIVQELYPEGLVTLEPLQTLVGNLTVSLPDYVEENAQIKINVLVQKRTMPYKTFQTAFYFIVSSAEDMTEVDDQPPICSEAVMCQTCPCEANQTFHSKLTVSDSKSGLRTLRVASPGSSLLVRDPWVIGTVRSNHFLVQTGCCFQGVELRVLDVAGNEAKCVIGINPNIAEISTKPQVFIVLAIALIIAVS